MAPQTNVKQMAIDESTPTIDERIAHLKEQVRAAPELCIERARFLSRSMKDSEGRPQLIRRSLALKKILSQMAVGIHPYELIVGNVTSFARGVPLVPETSGDWWETELDTFPQRDWDRIIVRDEIKEEVREIARYWRGKRLEDQAFASMSQELRDACTTYSSFAFNPVPLYQGSGRVSVDYGKVINRGLRGLQAEIHEARESKDPGSPGYDAQMQFYEAASMSIDAVIAFAARYAQLARSMAEKETNPARKKELVQIWEVCSQVPGGPGLSRSGSSWKALHLPSRKVQLTNTCGPTTRTTSNRERSPLRTPKTC
jgi:pyruvate-formate lyase